MPDGSLNSAANPAQPGDVLVFYATGEGQTAPPGEDGILAGVPLPQPILPVEVIIGDLPAEVLYFGAAPGFSGLVQVNAEIPQGLQAVALTEEGVPASSSVPIVATVGEGQSQENANITVGEGGGVVGDNEPPQADGKSVMTDEDTAVSIGLTGSDPDGDALTFSIASGPAHSALTGLAQNPPASTGVTYTPNGNYNGPDSFVFRADDGNAGSATAVVNITVRPVDDPPIANDDVFSTAKNQTATRNVLFNDSDPDDDPLSVVSVTQGANGSVTTDGTNATYDPDEDFVGSDSFNYTISDGNSTDSATVTVRVRPPGPSDNQAPVAANLSVMTNQDTDLVITLTGDDPDGDTLAFAITAPPANGTLGPITKTGTAAAMVTYTPNPNYDGPDSFGFRVNDGEETATATVSITVKPTTTLAIAKTLASAEFKASTQVTYQVTVMNNGPKDAAGLVVTDTLPPGLTFVSATGPSGCAAAGQVVTCGAIVLPMAAPNNVAVWTVTAMIDSAATGNVTNFAAVSSPTDPNSPKNAQDGPRAINVMADLSVDKAVTSAEFKAGQQATYTTTVTNNGPADATSVALSDTIPAPLSLVSATPSQGTPCAGDPAVTCNLGTITAGASATVTIVVDIPAGATGTVTNTTTVSLPDDAMTGNNSDTDMTAVNVMADLRIEKSDSPDPVVAGGGNLTYTITVTNDGPADATSVEVTDTLPAAGVTFVSTSGCSEDPNGVPTCNLGPLTAGASAQYTITVSVDPDASGTLTNTATVSAPEDTMTGNNTVMEDTTVQSNVDLSIKKTDGLTSVVAGTPLTYTITVSNAGPSDAVGATVSDTFPAELTNVTWTCAPAGAGSSCANAAGAGNLNESVNVGAAGTVTFTVMATVASSAMGTISNTAIVTPPGSATDTNPGNESATDDTAITKEADLTITKIDSPDPVVAGAQLVYTIAVMNNGPSDAADVVVSDTLPAGVSNAVTSGCNEDPAGVATCTLGPIASGASKQYTITVDVDMSTSGTLTNIASVASSTPLINTGDDSVMQDTTVNQEAELTITKSDNNDPVVAGSGMITYTVSVNNNGPSDASGVVVTDALPAGVTLVSTAGDCSELTGVPTCTLGTITASSSKQFTINVTVDSAATGTLTNNAMVASSTPLGAGSVTSVDEMTAVNTEATITVTKDDGVSSLIPGNPTTYAIMVSNAGPSDLIGAAVSDMFPAGITSTSTTSVAAGGATGNTAAFVGNISDTVTIPVSGSITYTVVAQTDPAATGSLANTVTVTGGAMTVLGTTSATDTDTLTPSGNLSSTKGDDIDSIQTGNVLTYTIVVSNSGPSTATGVTVTDTFPAEFTNPMWSCLAAGAGSSCAAMGAGNLAAQSVNIGPGGMVTFTVTGTISTAVATQITNTASLTFPAGFTDSDGAGNNMVMETTNLTVNDPPMASTAGSSTAGVVGELLTLMGSGSTDDGLPAPPAMLTFDWTFTSVPAGSAISTGATFSTLADTMFTPDIAGTYMATLTVDDSLANNQAMLTVTVAAASTTTAITSDSPDPSALNAPYTVSGTVTADAPSGATVNEGMVDVTGGSMCSSPVTSGAFSCMVTSTTAGAKTLVATYNGTTNFNGSVSAGEAHTVNMGTTTTSVDSSSPNPSIFPNAFQVSFTVTGAPPAPGPTGNVTVSLSGGGSCMGMVAAGSCMLTPTTMTVMQTLTATYPGDSNYQGSADATGIPHTVSPPPMANADNFDIIGNTPFEHAATQAIAEGLFFAGNVLSNDTGAGIMVTSASPITTALGASVTINASGEFIYDGDAACGPGDTNTSDSFMYSITGARWPPSRSIAPPRSGGSRTTMPGATPALTPIPSRRWLRPTAY